MHSARPPRRGASRRSRPAYDLEESRRERAFVGIKNDKDIQTFGLISSYSPANNSSGITWSEESFPKHIRAPRYRQVTSLLALEDVIGVKADHVHGVREIRPA
jgi:hypothetical protein